MFCDISLNFNAKYYELSNIDVDFTETNAMQHYVSIGWREGRNPNPWFSAQGYLAKNPDVEATGVEPFWHYLNYGRAEGRRWTELGNSIYEVVGNHFDEGFYLNSYSDIVSSKVSPLEHYIEYGWKEGRNPTPWFSSTDYIRNNDDVNHSNIEPFFHYLSRGRAEGRKVFEVKESNINKSNVDPNFLEHLYQYKDIFTEFDAEFYRSCYPDITGNDVECFDHFMTFGWKEGRNPARWFSTSMYSDSYQISLSGELNPFVHYIRSGRELDFVTYPAVSTGPLRLKIDPSATLIADVEIAQFAKLVRNPPRMHSSRFDNRSLKIHWVIPDFTGFSGGHSTIFQIARWFEFLGHVNTFWVIKSSSHVSCEDVYCDVAKRFQVLRASFQFVDSDLERATGDAIIATGWQTVPAVSRADGFLGRFYLIQDFEPAFFPIGAHYHLANLTYNLDFGCICASTWLSNKLKEEYNRWTADFVLAVDNTFYYPGRRIRNSNDKFRICVYARSSTPRRCVELALLALETLSRLHSNFEVVLFASDNKKARAPFPCEVYGYLSPSELGNLYRNCDMGICFSATNYSLVPQEMMACALPVFEMNSESSQAIFPDGVVTLAGPDPEEMAFKMLDLLKNRKKRSTQIKRASEWIKGLSWQSSSKQVLFGIQERLMFLGHRVTDVERSLLDNNLKASVCIPSFNGGNLLFEVLDMVKAQLVPWLFEIIVVDSSSTDGSSERLRQYEGIRFVSIDQKDFGHGKTRNLLCSLANGEFIAFLTQDAKPVSNSWLYNIVTMLERFPLAAGAFGRHVAYPGSSFLVTLDLVDHFHNISKLPLNVSKETDIDRWNKGDISWRQQLHFYSDNNSCMRKSVWRQIPYPDVDYGEDQLWALKIIEAGYEKIYVPLAIVYHSHEYNPQEMRERSTIEARFFKENFGYKMYDDTVLFEEQLKNRNNYDIKRAIEHNVDVNSLSLRFRCNEAALSGWQDGQSQTSSLATSLPEDSIEVIS